MIIGAHLFFTRACSGVGLAAGFLALGAEADLAGDLAGDTGLDIFIVFEIFIFD